MLNINFADNHLNGIEVMIMQSDASLRDALSQLYLIEDYAREGMSTDELIDELLFLCRIDEDDFIDSDMNILYAQVNNFRRAYA